MKVFSTRLRVRYADTDTSGIVYYASYFLYFETGRVEMFRELGLPYDYHLPIVETACRYRAPARFDDLLEVHSFVEGTRSKGFRIGHRVRNLRQRSRARGIVGRGATGNSDGFGFHLIR